MIRRRGGTARRLAGVLLVALAVLAVPVPAALGQAQTRPKPQELWRQFPLENARSNAQRPERRSAPPASPERSRRAAAADSDGSLTTFQIVAIGVTIWLLVTAMLYGLLRALRAARRRYVRARAATVRKRTDEMRALREGTIDGAASEGSAPAPSALEEAPDYATARESTADDELERLKAKLVLHRASPSSPADHELQILKAKRGRPGARADVERPAELETLKAKLAGNGAGGAPLKPRRKTAAGMGSKQRRT
jgi:hypothetical protein